MTTASRTNAPLGRGLSALFGESATLPPASQGSAQAPRSESSELASITKGARLLPVAQLHPSPVQPRRQFSETAIEELAASIREHGVLQPLLVRPSTTRTGDFEIIAGERRWRAAQRAELHELPVIVRELADREALEIALIENLQRQDLSPLEEAEGYQRLLDEFRHTQEGLAKTLGKSRSHIANTLRLLSLPGSVKEMIARGELTAGHARAILTAKDPVRLAKDIVQKGLSVREAEALARHAASGSAAAAGKAKSDAMAARLAKDADTLALEKEVSGWLGLRVTIATQGRGGTLTVAYESLDQLEDVLKRLSR